MTLDLLRTALADEPAEPVDPVLADVVARIRAIPPSPDGLRVARGNLVDALGDEHNSNLDVAAWRAAWSTVEAELAAIEYADDRVERQRARS